MSASRAAECPLLGDREADITNFRRVVLGAIAFDIPQSDPANLAASCRAWQNSHADVERFMQLRASALCCPTPIP